MEVINEILNLDVLDGLKEIPDNLVSVICTSPPYNVDASKWNYNSSSDDLPYKEYVQWLASVFKECYRVLRKGGRLVINIDAMTNRQDDKGEEYIRDIRTDLANELKPIGFKFYGEHIWWKNGQWNGKKTAWGSYMSCSFPAVRRSYEYILVYSKEQFKLEKTEESLDSDLTAEEFQTWIDSTWVMQAETRNLGNHPVTFPEELVRRVVKMYSYPNDIILDPFNGAGTTTHVAKQTKRRYIGIDIDKGYCEYARCRMGNTDAFDEFA